MTQYQVLDPLLHDGKEYRPGDTIKLTDDVAPLLIALGAIAPPPAPTLSEPNLSEPNPTESANTKKKASPKA